MSNIDKQAMRERYSAKPTPKCHICGTQMTVQRMSGSRVTYGCSGAIYDETGCHYAEGRSLADDHYEQSRVTVTDESDPDVLALLDELEAKGSRIAELEAADALNKHLELAIRKAEGCSEALRRKAEAAEKRIAEQRGIIESARKFISEYAGLGDVGAAEFIKIIDRAAAGKGE